MTSTTPALVVSGVPYTVVDVAGHAPEAVSDFVGDVTFTVEGSTGRHTVVGEGTAGETVARFHEKAEAGGKDVRVWIVYRDDDGVFVASAD